jgi:hypothetical protein
VLWTAPDLVLPDDGGFRAAAVGDTIVAQHCPGTCAAGELRGYDLATGEVRWTRPGAHRVAATGDGLALVGDGSAWELLDVATGAAPDGQRWDADAFDVGDDPAVGYVLREGGALVVARPGTVAVWLPAESDDGAAVVELP